MNDCFELRVRNVSGVPVLQIGGTITRHAMAAVRFNLDRLASAGHYNIVLNMERAQMPDWQVLSALSDAVQKIREHYGSVDVVAASDRIQQMAGIEQVAKLFRFCVSESQAISRIKGLLRVPDKASEINARLVERPE